MRPREYQQDAVVVASIQTMLSRMERWPVDHFGLVVVDEAHHVLADSYRRVLSRFDGHAKVLGVTVRRAHNLATAKQVRLLRRFGHPTPDKCTFAEAGVFLDSVFNRKRMVAVAQPEADESLVPF